MAVTVDPHEPWDNLHGPSRPDVHWSTDNVGEAAPGVLSPLGASIWTTIGERSTRGTFVGIGVLPSRELSVPEALEDHFVRVFYGRMAISVELMTMLGDRLPGTSGETIAKAMLGTVPEGIAYRPTVRRYPVIALRLSRTFLGMPSRLRRERPVYERFWRTSIERLPELGLDDARHLLGEGLRQFEAALLTQSLSVPGHVQLMYEALSSVVRRAGVGDLGVLSGSGGAEMDVVCDVWRASHGEISIDDVIARHGFHGPLEGEVSSRVWREDPAPLRQLIGEYAQREDPRRRHEAALARLPAEQEKVLAALPRASRPGARLVLRAAARRMPMRGVGKRGFLQGIDVIRGCARTIGGHLAQQGVLAHAEDAFYLTTGELAGPLPAEAPELVARRRERREAYRRLTIPGAWKGLAEATATDAAAAGAARPRTVSGVGVSAGTAEGIARVVTDPALAEVEPDEVLVAPTTDPSWASIMYISSALVVDMGGAISHAAVVARELGLPCVVNTRTGSRDIVTGDRVRVDGEAGTVEILEPAPT